jgi:hypothetical protein
MEEQKYQACEELSARQYVQRKERWNDGWSNEPL